MKFLSSGNLYIATLLVMLTTVSSLGAQTEPDALELYKKGHFTQAVQVCLQELQDRGTDEAKRRMDSYTVLGWSYIRLGQYKDALKYARQARNEVRYDIRIVEIEAEALYYMGQNLEALTLFEEYVSLSPTGERIDSVYYYEGEIFLRLAEFNHADIAFSTALYHNPQIARWWARLGYVREQISNIEGAEKAYSRALELKPSLNEAKAGLERVRTSRY